MKFPRILALTTQGAFLASLMGCSWIVGEEGFIKDRREEYREAVVAPPLKLPAGSDTQALGELYEIPGAGQALTFDGDEFDVPRPDTHVSAAPKDLRAFKSGNEYWIVLDGEPGQVWGRVRRFWDVNGIALAREIPYQGVMETVWLKRDSDGQVTRDKFRARVEHGLQKGMSEVHVAHLGYDFESPEISAEKLDWSQAKPGDELTLAMIQELSSFLIQTQTSAAPASLLAQKFEGQPKSSLSVTDSGEWVIDMRLSYGRAWNAVAKAIDAAGFELESRNRDAGTYQLIVNTGQSEEEEGGFFSFLSFGDDDAEAQSYRVSIQVKPNNGQVQAFISDYEERVSPELRKEILTRIKGQLI